MPNLNTTQFDPNHYEGFGAMPVGPGTTHEQYTGTDGHQHVRWKNNRRSGMHSMKKPQY